MRATSLQPGSAGPSRVRRRLLLALVWIPLVSAAGLELGARGLARARGRPHGAEELRADVAVACRTLSRRAFLPGGLPEEGRARSAPNTQVIQPYLGWEHLSTQESIVRGVEHYASARAERALDVCVLGGSVAQTFAEKGGPHLVARLQADERFAGREVLVHNYGCAGYKQPQPLMFLAYLLALGHAPDLVLELDGFNDAALAWANRAGGVHPAYPYHGFWGSVMKGLRPNLEWAAHAHAMDVSHQRALGFAEWFLASGLWRSSFLGQLGLARLAHLRGEYAASYERLRDYVASRPKEGDLKGPDLPADDAAAARAIVRVWEESARAMQGICRENGIAFLHVLQPTLHDAGSKPLSEKERAGAGAEPSWIEGVQRLYPLLRVAGTRLAAEGVAFLDASGVFRPYAEDLYVDVCHLNERGNEILADALAAAVMDALAHEN